MVKNLCIVQARLTSTRLPNKVLMALGDSGLTLLEHVYNRLIKSKYIDKVVFAIPESKQNDELATFLSNKNIEYYRGSENDVLSRFYECAIKYQPEYVVRATCDNPLVDWELIDYLFDQIDNVDYISTDDTPLGTSAELFTMESLSEANQKAIRDEEREHVTPYIIRHKNSVLTSYNGLSYRLTVDEERDLEVINVIYRNLYQGIPIPNKNVYEFLSHHPEIAQYNMSVHQKELEE
jgi:spore coat polysaccharide biosynthesis protein SpsF